MTAANTSLYSQISIWPEILWASQKAALAAAKFIGRGDNNAADQAAVEAMREVLNSLTCNIKVVIGEGERDEAPMLFIGEILGREKFRENEKNLYPPQENQKIGGENDNIHWHIAVDPLEGTNLCAKNMPGAMTAIAIAEPGGLLAAPDIYMMKLAVGKNTFPEQSFNLDLSVQEIVEALAKKKNSTADNVTIALLERERHQNIEVQIRQAGARIKLISDGDLAACIATCIPNTGIDGYIGIGGAPEGVIAAAAVKVMGGQMVGQLMTVNKIEKIDQVEVNKKVDLINDKSIHWPKKNDKSLSTQHYSGYNFIDKEKKAEELAPGHRICVVLSGVTSGYLLKGVKEEERQVHSLVFNSEIGVFEINTIDIRD